VVIKFNGIGFDRWFKVAVVLLLPGCATPVYRKVEGRVALGDPSSKVFEILGQPERYLPSQAVYGADEWIYSGGGDICDFLIKNHKVLNIACADDPNTFWRNFVRAMASGGNHTTTTNTIHCTSMRMGSLTETECK
jgi:hypothetical protein